MTKIQNPKQYHINLQFTIFNLQSNPNFQFSTISNQQSTIP